VLFDELHPRVGHPLLNLIPPNQQFGLILMRSVGIILIHFDQSDPATWL